jgi:hypothetical protein
MPTNKGYKNIGFSMTLDDQRRVVQWLKTLPRESVQSPEGQTLQMIFDGAGTSEKNAHKLVELPVAA